LAFASLAGALRESVPWLDVRILDAAVLRLGDSSVAAVLRQWQPAFLGIGEEAVHCADNLRLARWGKTLGAAVIAGGCCFAFLAPEILATGLVDVVVHGEGEQTLVELVHAWHSDGLAGLDRVRGISFARNGQVIRTPPRPLLGDLDQLPWPAYDLLPVEHYGRSSRNHPAMAAIELGRGCHDSCDFCVLWRQMGHVVRGQSAPRLRVKSSQRLEEEIVRLARRFHRRYLGWVDPCFNAHPDIPARLAERLLQRNLRLGQSAWIRSDHLLRDQASGALDLCVRAGLNEVYIGIERPDAKGLEQLNKHARPAQARIALEILRRQYPSVFTVGSFIYGLAGDSPATMRRIYEEALALGLDLALFIPLNPLPGTRYWRADQWDGTGEALRRLDFLPPPPSESARPELERELLRCFMLHWSLDRLRIYWRGLAGGGARKRRMFVRVLWRGTRFALQRAGWRGHRNKTDSRRKAAAAAANAAPA